MPTKLLCRRARAYLLALLTFVNCMQPVVTVRACDDTDPTYNPPDDSTEDSTTEDSTTDDSTTDDSTEDTTTDDEVTTTEDQGDTTTTEDQGNTTTTEDQGNTTTTEDQGNTTTTEDQASTTTTEDASTTTTQDATTTTTTADETTTTCDECSDSCTNPGNAKTVNNIAVLDGNAQREVTELTIHGARGRLGLSWSRYHNTLPRAGALPFGTGGSWRHSWQYDLVVGQPAAGATQPEYQLIYPSGRRVWLHPASAGHWQADVGLPERASLTAGGMTVELNNSMRAYFARVKLPSNAYLYEARTVTDGIGFVSKLDYDKDGNLTRVTEPGGRQLTLTYRAVAFQKGAQLVLGTIKVAPAAGQWLEIAVPANLAGVAFNHLRLRNQTSKPAMAVAEVQFLAPGSTTPIRGVAVGTGDNPAAAFDGNPATIFQSNRPAASVCGLNLDANNLSKVARIRILAAPGKESTLVGTVIEGFAKSPASRSVLAKVTASNGQSVAYNYAVVADPLNGSEFVALSQAQYTDGTQASYQYASVTPVARPMLVQADDPGFVGRAKQIRYGYYDDEPGMLHQEINPATGAVYASLEFDAKDPNKRTVQYSDLKEEVYHFDAQRRLVEKVDSLGRSTRWEYQPTGKGPAIAQIDHDGHRTEWTMDDHGKVLSMRRDGKTQGTVVRDQNTGTLTKTDRYGRSTVTSHPQGPQGKVKQIQHADGTVEQAIYGANGKVAEQHTRDGRVLRYAYDKQGHKISSTDTSGQTTRYEYDAYERLAAVTDPLGRTTRYERNRRDQVTKITHTDGTTQQFTYDAYGRATSVTDEAGRTTTNTYDSLGRLTRQSDPVGRITTFDYTDLPQGCSSCSLVNHPSRIQYPDGRVATMLYDTGGRLLSRTEAVGTNAQATTTYAYDDDDNLTSLTDPMGRTHRYTYDNEHHRLTATDPLGRVTKLAYDDHGRVVSMTAPDGAKVSHEYDANGRRTATTQADGNTTHFNRDTYGKLAMRTDAKGNTYRHTYDANNRRTAVSYADGRSRTWAYDAAGRVASTTTPDGAKIAYTRDARNRILTVSQSSASSPSSTSSSTYTYDTLGHRLSATDALGRVTKWTYDARGNMLSQTGPDGATTSYQYDSQDRPIASVDPLGHTTHFAYDAASNLASLSDANGSTYKFNYDALHRRTAMIYPDGSQEKWTYDLAGALTAYVNRTGQTKTIAYNAGGLPLSETWSASPQSLVPSLPNSLLPSLPSATTYAYDSAGRVTKIDNGQAKLTYDYDSAGRLASETSDLSALVRGLDPQTVSYSYDELGRSAGLKYPDRTQVSYDYDSQGRLTVIDTDDAAPSGSHRTPLATYAYDSLGRITQLSRDNGVVTTYGYDAASQLLEIMNLLGRTTLASSKYTLDAAGRRTTQTREDGITEKYGYDATSQLTSVDYGLPVGSSASTSTSNLNQAVLPLSEAFSYDPVGNRTQTIETPNAKSQNPNVVTYTANNLNQYTKVASVAFAYDPNGNLTSDGQQTYRYDAQNRLIAMENAQTHLDLFYDARNRCVLRRYYTKGSQNQWVLDNANSRALTYDNAWNLLTERTLDGDQVGEYVHGLRTDEILVANLATSTSTSHFNSKLESVYPLADGLGSTVALADDHGSVTQRYRYDAYGTPHILSSDYRPLSTGSAYRFLFTGREWLASVGVNGHRNRYYSPGLGRWLTTDPIKFTGGINLYKYSRNAPIFYADSSGLCCEQEKADVDAGIIRASMWVQYGIDDQQKAIKAANQTVADFDAIVKLRDSYQLGIYIEATVGVVISTGQIVESALITMVAGGASLVGQARTLPVQTAKLDTLQAAQDKIAADQADAEYYQALANQDTANAVQAGNDLGDKTWELTMCLLKNQNTKPNCPCK